MTFTFIGVVSVVVFVDTNVFHLIVHVTTSIVE